MIGHAASGGIAWLLAQAGPSMGPAPPPVAPSAPPNLLDDPVWVAVLVATLAAFPAVCWLSRQPPRGRRAHAVRRARGKVRRRA